MKRKINLTHEILRVVSRWSKPRTLAEISDALGLDPDQRKFVSRALHELALRGLVQKWSLDYGQGRVLNGYTKPLKHTAHRAA